LTYTSNQECKTNADEKFKFVIEGTCSEAPANIEYGGAPNKSVVEQAGCLATVKFFGPQACPVYVNHFEDAFAGWEEYFGTLSIIFGLLLCLYGAHMLIYFFMAAMSVTLLTTMNMLAYNLLMSSDSNRVLVFLLMVTVTIVCIALSRFIYEFTRKWAVILIAMWSGIIFVLGILKLLKVNSASINLIGVFFGTLLGYLLGLKYYNTIPSFSASMIGAFFIIKGVASYAGHYP